MTPPMTRYRPDGLIHAVSDHAAHAELRHGHGTDDRRIEGVEPVDGIAEFGDEQATHEQRPQKDQDLEDDGDGDVFYPSLFIHRVTS